MTDRRLTIALCAALLAGAACAPPRAVEGPVPVPSAEARLAMALDSVFADTAFAGAHWGMLAVRERDGRVLYARNAAKMFVPASNVKVVTAAGVLEALGPGHRWRTTVAAAGPVEDGVLRGDLVVVGSGDPTLSAQFHDAPDAVLRAWADSLRRLGVRRIEGRVVGDDDVFDDLPYGAGWAWDDVGGAYSAQVGGLLFNEGVAPVRVEPAARAGEPARVSAGPGWEDLPVAGGVTTAEAGVPTRLRFEPPAAGTGVRVEGVVPVGGEPLARLVPVANNTLFLATVLRETLREAGIEVAGPAADADDLGADERGTARTPLFTHASPPLADVLPAFLQPSQNQIGEVLLKTLGRELRGAGTAEAGVAVIDSLVGVWGLDRGQLAQADGSGLSRYNLAAPELLAGILLRMERGPHRAVWRAALPVMGRSGTLARRLQGTPLEGRVVAKTGTLSGVRALSGYLDVEGGETIVFSTVVNHHTRSARDADRVVDAALRRIAEVAGGGGA